MSIHTLYLLLGSNLGDRKKNISQAKTLINEQVGEIINFSETIETEPVGFQSEHWFLNTIVVCETILSPMSALKHTQDIEKRIGRKDKSSHNIYKDRLIDIDILLFNNINFFSEKLTIPHLYNVEKREFCGNLLQTLIVN